MSDLAAIALGAGIGLLIGLPAIVAFRHDISARVRSLLGLTNEEQEKNSRQADPPRADSIGSEVPHASTAALSPVVVLFGVGAALICLLYGLVSGGPIFIVTGAFSAMAVGSAFLGSRVRRS